MYTYYLDFVNDKSCEPYSYLTVLLTGRRRAFSLSGRALRWRTTWSGSSTVKPWNHLLHSPSIWQLCPPGRTMQLWLEAVGLWKARGRGRWKTSSTGVLWVNLETTCRLWSQVRSNQKCLSNDCRSERFPQEKDEKDMDHLYWFLDHLYWFFKNNSW